MKAVEGDFLYFCAPMLRSMVLFKPMVLLVDLTDSEVPEGAKFARSMRGVKSKRSRRDKGLIRIPADPKAYGYTQLGVAGKFHDFFFMTDSQQLLDQPVTFHGLEQLLYQPVAFHIPEIIVDRLPTSSKVFDQSMHNRYMGLMSRMVELTADERQEFHDLMELNENENAHSPSFTGGTLSEKKTAHSVRCTAYILGSKSISEPANDLFGEIPSQSRTDSLAKARHRRTISSARR